MDTTVKDDQPPAPGPIKETPPVRSAFFDPETIAWSPWVLPNTEFKLLNIHPTTGGFTILLRVPGNDHAPIHGHIGTVEGIITRGGFGYGSDRGRAGWYVLEHGGINHKPDTDADGFEMLAVAHGPLCGFNDDGTIAGVLDAKLMYTLARDAGQAGHITPPDHWSDI